MVYNFQQRGWDWDMLPIHPTTQQQYRPPTATSTTKPPTNVGGQPTAFQQQQAQQNQQAEMKQRLEAERKRREKMLLEQQKQFAQKRDQMAGQITDAATRQKFLYQQSQAEREFRLARAGLDNPILRAVNQKTKYQPAMFNGLHSKDTGSFLNAWMAQWGSNKKRDTEALKILSIYGLRKSPYSLIFEPALQGTGNSYLQNLILQPAKALNDPALTNMTDEAMALLMLNQLRQEPDNWDRQNNRVNPYYNRLDGVLGGFIDSGGDISRALLEAKLTAARFFGVLAGGSNFIFYYQTMMEQAAGKPLRLAGPSLGLGNRYAYQVDDALQWYHVYSDRGIQARYYPNGVPDGEVASSAENFYPNYWNSKYATFPLDQSGMIGPPTPWLANYPPYRIQNLIQDMSNPDDPLYYQAITILWAGARQREGNFADPRLDEAKRVTAIDYYYALSNSTPLHSQEDVSAFSIVGTIHTDETDLSSFMRGTTGDAAVERNKAIRVIEGMADPNQQNALGVTVTPFVDFTPYTPGEAQALVNALRTTDEGRKILCQSPLLKESYIRSGQPWPAELNCP